MVGLYVPMNRQAGDVRFARLRVDGLSERQCGLKKGLGLRVEVGRISGFSGYRGFKV